MAAIAKDTVRIKDLDQEITNPDGDGFISTPTFDFGKLAISGSKQQYGLKKAADYYDNGTRNPYLRLNTSQDNWSLTAQLSQPKSATDRLPTTTRLLLGTYCCQLYRLQPINRNQDTAWQDWHREFNRRQYRNSGGREPTVHR